MKILYTLFLAGFFLLCSLSNVIAQDHDHHHHGRNEIGVNAGALYGLDDKEWGAGVHVHYFRKLGDHSRWSVGGFVEQTMFLDNHFSLGAGVKFEVIEKLFLTAMPGVTFTKHDHSAHEHSDHDSHAHDDKTKSKFSVHGEIVYTLFEWDKFHMGPAFDYSWSKNDSHIMLGIHAAFDF